MYDFATAVIGCGKDNITFKDIAWSISNGDPTNKPVGQDFVVDEVKLNSDASATIKVTVTASA